MSDPYKFKTLGGDSQYLRLKSKGDSAKIRICSDPYVERKVWDNESNAFLEQEKVSKFTDESWNHVLREPRYTVSEVFSWKVIDRADGRAKLYQGGAPIFRRIGALADMEDWGDPRGYDITITRTEEPGAAYWNLMPSPNKSDITEEEAAAVKALDIEKLAKFAKSTTDEEPLAASDSPKAEGPGHTKAKAKAAEIKEKAAKEEEPEEEAITDIGDEPINLDDIPF